MEWEEFEKNIMKKSFINYRNELVIIVRMHIDGITPMNQETLVSFKHDFRESLKTLGFERGSEELKKYVDEHIAKIKEAFRKKLAEIIESKEVRGNAIEFYIDDSGEIKHRHRSEDKHFKFKEIRPSRG